MRFTSMVIAILDGVVVKSRVYKAYTTKKKTVPAKAVFEFDTGRNGICNMVMWGEEKDIDIIRRLRSDKTKVRITCEPGYYTSYKYSKPVEIYTFTVKNIETL